MLTEFTFSLEYQKGWDNPATDVLSLVMLRLDMETVMLILGGVTMVLTGRADAHDPVVAETGEEIHKQVQEAAIQARAAHTHVNLHMTHWVAAQQEDPVLKAVINWVPNQKVQVLKLFLGDNANTEERMAILRECKKLMLYQGSPLPLLYTGWWAGRSFVVHIPHGSLSGCYEQMSPIC